jgi:hypothetical protein
MARSEHRRNAHAGLRRRRQQARSKRMRHSPQPVCRAKGVRKSARVLRRPASINNDLCASADMTAKRAAIYGACIAAAFIVLLLVRYQETLWGLWI